jgi:hypothetical protein
MSADPVVEQVRLALYEMGVIADIVTSLGQGELRGSIKIQGPAIVWLGDQMVAALDRVEHVIPEALRAAKAAAES